MTNDRQALSERSESREQWVHLPIVVAGEFAMPRSEARRHIALGHVSVNGQVTTDLDIDLDAIEGDEIEIRVDFAEPRDSILRILDMGRRS